MELIDDDDYASLLPVSPSYWPSLRLPRLPEVNGVTTQDGIIDILDTVLAILDDVDDIVDTMMLRFEHHHATPRPRPRQSQSQSPPRD